MPPVFTSVLAPFTHVLPALLPLFGQVTPDVLRIIDQGGSKAVIAVLAGVVVYLARENAKLHTIAVFTRS